MSDRPSEQRRVVCEALASRTSCIEANDGRRWRISLDDFADEIVDVCLDDDWLGLSAPIEPFGAPPEILRRNAELRGGVKLALRGAPSGPELRLSAEMPLDDPQPIVQRRIVQACAAFASVHGPTTKVDDPCFGKLGEAADLGTLLAEAEWLYDERPDGSLTVDLRVPDDFFQAHLAQRNGVTRLAVELGNLDAAPEVCRRAAALLLLRSAAVVRMARPVLDDDGVLRVEVVLDGGPSVGEISHALSALTVACRLFGREVDLLLRSEPFAERYCARHGWGGAEATLAETG